MDTPPLIAVERRRSEAWDRLRIGGVGIGPRARSPGSGLPRTARLGTFLPQRAPRARTKGFFCLTRFFAAQAIAPHLLRLETLQKLPDSEPSRTVIHHSSLAAARCCLLVSLPRQTPLYGNRSGVSVGVTGDSQASSEVRKDTSSYGLVAARAHANIKGNAALARMFNACNISALGATHLPAPHRYATQRIAPHRDSTQRFKML